MQTQQPEMAETEAARKGHQLSVLVRGTRRPDGASVADTDRPGVPATNIPLHMYHTHAAIGKQASAHHSLATAPPSRIAIASLTHNSPTPLTHTTQPDRAATTPSDDRAIHCTRWYCGRHPGTSPSRRVVVATGSHTAHLATFSPTEPHTATARRGQSPRALQFLTWLLHTHTP